jgi:hypothetical protein
MAGKIIMGAIITNLETPIEKSERYAFFRTHEEAVQIIKEMYIANEVCFSEFIASIAINECSLEDVQEILAELHHDINGDNLLLDYGDGKYSDVRTGDSIKFYDETEDALKEKMEEGWGINIECKAKDRTYGMTYEATAHKGAWGSKEFIQYHGVGSTIKELAHDLFVNYPAKLEKLKNK